MSARSKKRVEISVCNAPANSEMVVAASRSEIEVARKDSIHQLALFLFSVHAQRIVTGNAKTKTSTAEEGKGS